MATNEFLRSCSVAASALPEQEWHALFIELSIIGGSKAPHSVQAGSSLTLSGHVWITAAERCGIRHTATPELLIRIGEKLRTHNHIAGQAVRRLSRPNTPSTILANSTGTWDKAVRPRYSWSAVLIAAEVDSEGRIHLDDRPGRKSPNT